MKGNGWFLRGKRVFFAHVVFFVIFLDFLEGVFERVWVVWGGLWS
jgi:hypothetical protein